MFKRALFSVGLAALVAAPASATPNGGDLDGEQAPDINVAEWVRGNRGTSLKALRGKAVLIEFFATW